MHPAETTPRVQPLSGLSFEEWLRTRYVPIAGADGEPAAAPAAEPEPGQGSEGGLGLYDLHDAPEHLRPHLEAELKKIEANVTKRFQEAAEFRKQWEPFADVEGLQDLSPTDVQSLVHLAAIVADPQAFESWWTQVGEAQGWFASDEAPAAEGGEQNGALDQTQLQTFSQQLEQMLDKRLGPIEEFTQEQQREARLREVQDKIRTDLDSLAEEHGEFDEDAVLQLALAYPQDPEAVKRGFEDYQRIIGSAEKGLVENKLEQPEKPTPGGRPAAPEPITNFEQARKAALARLGASV